MTDDRMRQMAEDLAAHSHQSVEEAAAALRAAMTITTPLMPKMRRLPWYLRWWWRHVPIRWQQKWVLRELERTSG